MLASLVYSFLMNREQRMTAVSVIERDNLVPNVDNILTDLLAKTEAGDECAINMARCIIHLDGYYQEYYFDKKMKLIAQSYLKRLVELFEEIYCYLALDTTLPTSAICQINTMDDDEFGSKMVDMNKVFSDYWDKVHKFTYVVDSVICGYVKHENGTTLFGSDAVRRKGPMSYIAFTLIGVSGVPTTTQNQDTESLDIVVDYVEDSQVILACDWNKSQNRLKRIGDSNGCYNEAKFIVGKRTKYMLCESCAALPRFRTHQKVGL